VLDLGQLGNKLPCLFGPWKFDCQLERATVAFLADLDRLDLSVGIDGIDYLGRALAGG